MTTPRKRTSPRRRARQTTAAAASPAAPTSEDAIGCKFDETMPPRRNVSIEAPAEPDDTLPPAFEETPRPR